MPELLKVKRILSKVSQKELAEKLNMTPNGYRNKENGKQEFKQTEIKKIKDLFNLTLEEVDQIFFT